MIYDAARVKRWCTKFQVNTWKNKIFILGGSFFFFGGGTLEGEGLDCGQYQILTDPCNDLMNPNMNFGNDRSHRLGGVWRQTERRRTDDRQTAHRWQTTDRRQTDRIFKSLCALRYLRLLRRLDNNNKVDVLLPHILVRKLHTQDCEIVGGTKRELCKKFQVDICKTKEDRSAHAQLRTLQLRSKPWFIMRQWSGGCLQNFKPIHAKLKKDRSVHAQLRQAMIYNAARVRRLPTKLEADTCKTKKR